MNKTLRWSFIVVFFGLLQTSCLQTENSSAGDKTLYAPASAEFTAVKTILATSCTGCHNFHEMTEDELKVELVTPGNFETSELYYRLNGSSGAGGPKTMPPSGGSLTANQLDAFEAWILGL